MINPDDEPVHGSEFVDLGLTKSDKLDRVWYRLVAENPDGQTFDGPEVGFFESLSLPDLKASRRMFTAEVQRLRSGGAVPAWLVPASNNSTRNPGLFDSAAIVSNVCVYESQGGQPVVPRKGGMWQTWVQLLDVQMQRKQETEGLGESQTVSTSARLPGHPMPDRGSLIILPHSDDRYVVGESLKPYLFHGFVPIAWQVELQRLARSDPRYKMAVPTLNKKMATPMFRPLQ